MRFSQKRASHQAPANRAVTSQSKSTEGLKLDRLRHQNSYRAVCFHLQPMPVVLCWEPLAALCLPRGNSMLTSFWQTRYEWMCIVLLCCSNSQTRAVGYKIYEYLQNQIYSRIICIILICFAKSWLMYPIYSWQLLQQKSLHQRSLRCQAFGEPLADFSLAWKTPFAPRVRRALRTFAVLRLRNEAPPILSSQHPTSCMPQLEKMRTRPPLSEMARHLQLPKPKQHPQKTLATSMNYFANTLQTPKQLEWP